VEKYTNKVPRENLKLDRFKYNRKPIVYVEPAKLSNDSIADAKLVGHHVLEGQGLVSKNELKESSNANQPKLLNNRWAISILRLLHSRLRRLATAIDSFFSSYYKLTYFSMLLIALFGVVGIYIHSNIEASRRYDLASSVQQLLATPSVAMDKELSYSSTTKTYTLNKAAFTSSGASSDSIQVGSGNTAATTLYGAKIPTSPSSPLTIVDKTTGISFGITPTYRSATAKAVTAAGNPVLEASNTSSISHIVYPIANQPATTVYTIENNGVKEDVALTSSPKNGIISLSYKLDLPSTLAAKLLPSGAIGVYSASSALYGNISYGSNNDRALVAKARSSSAKTNLLFELPAPVITQTGSKPLPASVVSKFSLSGDKLTVTASNLSKLNYPIVIDPSVVDSASNIECASTVCGGSGSGDINISSGAVSTGNLSGGTVGNWTDDNTGTTGCTTTCGYNEPTTNGGAAAGGSVAYNGYLYTVGGVYNNNGTSDYNVEYAAINSTTGSIGAWSSAGPMQSIGDAYLPGVVAYNGYLYVIGGSASQASPGVNVLQYAQIQSSGSLGTWNIAALSFGGITGAGAAAYDGYMYLVGGCTLNCSSLSGAYTSTTEYAKINADGSLGTWTTISSGAGALLEPESVTLTSYNGYLYAAENCSSISGSFALLCSSATNAIEYAPILTGGGIGAWNTTSSFSGTNGGQALVASNGYLYLFGGYNGSSFVTTSQYAQINSDGTIGAWSTTGSFTTGRAYPMLAAYNGYIYVTGGQNAAGTYIGDTDYATVNSPGQTVAPTFTSNGAFTTAWNQGSAAVLNGFLYFVGGCNSTDCSVLSGTVYFTSISSTGALSSPGVGVSCSGVWCIANDSYGQSIDAGGLVAYDGYLTGFGGCETSSGISCNSASAGERYVQPLSNGNITSTWAVDSAGSFADGLTRFEFGTAVYGNYIYIISGATDNSGISTTQDVQYAELSPTGGIVVSGVTSCPGGAATWCDPGTTNQLPTVEEYAGNFAYNGYLYSVGGSNATSTTNIYFTQVNSSTGALSTPSAGTGVGTCTGVWCQLSTGLPITNYGMGVIENKGYVYILAGANHAGPVIYNNVSYAVINSNGTFGAFTTITGGTSGAFTADRFTSAYATYNDNIYAVAGDNNGGGLSGTDGYEVLHINNGGNGDIGAFSTLPSGNDFANARFSQATVAYNGYLYLMGGFDGATFYNDVQSAKIGSGGTLSAWTTLTGDNFNIGRFAFNALANNGYLYIIGGASNASVACGSTGTELCNDVQYATFNGSGGLSAPTSCPGGANYGGTIWCEGTNFNTARAESAAAVYNGYLYIMGGCTNDSAGCINIASDVQYTPINNNGSLGASWTTDTSSPLNSLTVPGAGMLGFSAVAYNGYMYAVGGCSAEDSGGSCTNLDYDVQYAPININGSLGTWASTSSMPDSIEGSFTTAYNGYIYVIGGDDNSAGDGTLISTVYSAPINLGGSLGSWTNDPNGGSAIVANTGYLQSGAVYNGFLYIMGGLTSGGGAGGSNMVEEAGFDTPPQIANFIYGSDLTGLANDNPLPYDLLFSGSINGNPGMGSNSGLGTGGLQASYQIASSACTNYGPLTTISSAGGDNPTLNSLIPLPNTTLINSGCSPVTPYGRYLALDLTLDDSQTTIFPNVDSNHTTINSFTINYHPQTNTRLRGGQTFTSTGTDHSLDAP
jgi:hypothetical protein